MKMSPKFESQKLVISTEQENFQKERRIMVDLANVSLFESFQHRICVPSKPSCTWYCSGIDLCKVQSFKSSFKVRFYFAFIIFENLTK